MPGVRTKLSALKRTFAMSSLSFLDCLLLRQTQATQVTDVS